MGPSVSSEASTAGGEVELTAPLQTTEVDSPPISQNHSDGLPPTNLERAWGLTQGDRRVVSVFVVVAFLLMVVNWGRVVSWQPSYLTVERPTGVAYQFVVDVNTATWVEWMQLDGIGETMARRIVAYREENGPFSSIEEVDQVPGIGIKTFEKIRDVLVCTPPETQR